MTPRRTRTVTAAALAAALLAGLAFPGCESTPKQISAARRETFGTVPITHIVLVTVKDPTRIAELVSDCDVALPGIRSVASYSCGVPMVSDRPNVLRDFDVGLYVGFRTEADYRAYLDDPAHLELVAKWKDGWKSVRIYDVVEGIAPASAVVLPPAASGTAPAPAAAETAAPAARP
ncbi:MAG: Dabb family protein [Phycisphaerales bacterium]